MKRLLPPLIACLFSFASVCIPAEDRGDANADGHPHPIRIISLCLPVTEIICELGLEDSIIGICDGDCPEKVKDRPKVGKAFGMTNIESVIAMRPDLVFCWGEGAIFKEKGLSVYSVSTRNLDGVIGLVEDVADLLGERRLAEKTVADMKDKVARIARNADNSGKRPLVYFEAGSMGKTRGPGSLTNELIEKAGGNNLAGKEMMPFPILSNEFIIASNPDIIVVENFGESNEEIASRSGWQNIKAVRNGRIFRSSTCHTNYSPRCIDGLEQFARWFHPETVK